MAQQVEWSSTVTTAGSTSALTLQNLQNTVDTLKGTVTSGYVSTGLDWGSETESDKTYTTTWRNPNWVYDEYYPQLKKLVRDYWTYNTHPTVIVSDVWFDDVATSNSKEKKMTISDKLRDLTKTDDQRLLEQHGIVEADGTLTDEGETVVLERLFATIRDGIVADLKKLEETDKKSKKS